MSFILSNHDDLEGETGRKKRKRRKKFGRNSSLQRDEMMIDKAMYNIHIIYHLLRSTSMSRSLAAL